jgi:uncharacterized repeat protein (TIGR01451 family)
VTFASAAGCSHAGGQVTCAIGSVAAGASVGRTVTVTATSPGQSINQASVSGTEQDPDLGDNAASATVSVTAPPAADVTLSLTAAPSPVVVGGTVTATLTVANAGPDAATDVTTTATLPPGLAFASASTGCAHAAGTVTCAVGTIAAGAQVQRTIMLTALAPGTASIAASASAAQDDPVPANNTASAQVVVQAPPAQADLRVAKLADRATATIGDLIAYTLSVTNEGPDAAAGVVLTDPLPAGVAYSFTRDGACTADDGTVTLQVGDLDVDAVASCTVVVVAQAAGTVVNTASVDAATADPDTGNDAASATVTISAPEQPSERISGVDRIATAVEASRSSYDDGAAGAVVLARADAFPDALAGSPFAVRVQAPLLLSFPQALSPLTEAEIQRVLPAGGTVYVLGGTGALGPAVEQRLATLGYRVVRFAGPNRFATAVRIAEATASPGAVFVTTGLQFPDALTSGAAAALVDGVIVLTAGDRVPVETAAYLAARPGVTRYAVGGPAARAVPTATPIVGADRFATALAVADRFFEAPTALGVAVGTNFPDALAGVTHIGLRRGPMVLTLRSALPASVTAYLQRNGSIAQVFIYGGAGAVSAEVEDQIVAALAP